MNSRQKNICRSGNISISDTRNDATYFAKPLPQSPCKAHRLWCSTVSLYDQYIKKYAREINNYRFAMRCCALTATAVLLTNSVLTVWAVKTSRSKQGLGTLYHGNCQKVKTISFWAHLAINSLSTILISASNYSMQCLSAPTRAEIDKAHSNGISLDVGVPSFKNLLRVSKIRAFLWWLLALSSIPLHLFYNSAVFSSLCTREYLLAVMSETFVYGSPVNMTSPVRVYDGSSPVNINGPTLVYDDPSSMDNKVPIVNYLPLGGGNGPSDETQYSMILDLQKRMEAYQQDGSTFQNLTNEECIEQYTAPLLTKNSDVLLISTDQNWTHSKIELFLLSSELVAFVTGDFTALNQWKCTNASCVGSGDTYIQGYAPLDIFQAQKNAEMWTVDGYRIQYCLAQPVQEECRLQFSLTIMAIVISCNLVKTICFYIIIWKGDPRPLIILGDAIASFLDESDQMLNKDVTETNGKTENNIAWDLFRSGCMCEPQYWFRAASKRRWIMYHAL